MMESSCCFNSVTAIDTNLLTFTRRPWLDNSQSDVGAEHVAGWRQNLERHQRFAGEWMIKMAALRLDWVFSFWIVEELDRRACALLERVSLKKKKKKKFQN
jgi:hypothetical protein